MFRLPVSQIDVEFRPPAGADDMLLLEADGAPLEIALQVAERLARRADAQPLHPASLPMTDLEALLLGLRRALFGDAIESRARCPVPSCGAAIAVGFGIGEYLRRHRARTPADCEPEPGGEGWFRLRDGDVRFRLVTCADVTAALRSPDPARELAGCAIRAGSPQAAARAMEAMAPPLSGPIAGRCPECGALARFWFDVCAYVLREMRYEAEFLYHDVHLLASRFHWTEEAILALPRPRRLQYAAMELGEGGN